MSTELSTEAEAGTDTSLLGKIEGEIEGVVAEAKGEVTAIEKFLVGIVNDKIAALEAEIKSIRTHLGFVVE